VCRDITHLLSRITSVRRQLPSPSAVSIAVDFLVNDPVAFLLVALLLAVLPGLFMYLYFSHHISNSVPRLASRKNSSNEAEGGGSLALQRHRSWLLGFTVQQQVISSRDADCKSRMYKYMVTAAMADGPCKRSVNEGDQLLSIDGHDVEEMDLHAFILQARGRARLSVAEMLSTQFDPVRRALGMRVVPLTGRGSRALVKILRLKKDGRRQTRDVWLVRGNWNGIFDGVDNVGGQAVGADGGGVRDGDTIGFFEWLRDLRKGKEHGVEETAHASADTHRSVSNIYVYIIYVCIHIYIYICILYVYTNVHLYMYLHMYIYYMCVFVYICIYMYIYIHISTHTHICVYI